MSAAVAEAIHLAQPRLVLVTEAAPQPSLIDTDTIPEFGFVRRRAAQEAAQILRQNRNLIIDGQFDKPPVPVDALGTARFVRQTEQQFGSHSPEHQEALDGLQLDCDRLLGEALRKNTWEYFPKAAQHLDESGQYYRAHGIRTLDIMERGLSPTAEPEERDRRANEYVEEMTYHAVPRMMRHIGRLGVDETVDLVMVSECTDWAIHAHDRDSKGGHGGYAPAINKFKIRRMQFEADGTRWQEELALPGTHITADVIREVLHEQVGASAQALSKTELHGKVWQDSSGQGLIGFAAKLDEAATKRSGQNIYMGEVVPDEFAKDYKTIEQQAASRQAKRTQQSYELRDFILNLEANQVDVWAAEGIVEAKVKGILFQIARQNPDQAEHIFDKKTADGLRKVAELEEQGNIGEADKLLNQVEAEAPEASYCGGGGSACGLETVAEGTPDAIKARLKGLRGRLKKDKVRACKACSDFGLVYSVETGDTACGSCGSSKIGGVINANYN